MRSRSGRSRVAEYALFGAMFFLPVVFLVRILGPDYFEAMKGLPPAFSLIRE